MYVTPEGYSDIASNPYRRETVNMSMGIYIDNTAADDIESATGNLLELSDTSQLVDTLYEVSGNLATFESFGIATASPLVAPPVISTDRGLSAGVWSSGISDANGSIDWTLTIALSNVHTSALTVYTSGPNVLTGYAVLTNNGVDTTIQFDCYEGRMVASGEYTYETIAIHITSIDQPYMHVRVSELEFGDSVSIGLDQLTNQIVYIDEIDPLYIGIPMKELDFDLINVKGQYDEDNPNSMYSRLAIGNPIYLSYTLYGTTSQVTVPMGRFVIGEKGSRGSSMSVVAYDVRWRLTQMYNSWSLSTEEDIGTTLGDLLDSIEMEYEVDSAVNLIYPLADHTFGTDTTLLQDIQLVLQAYGITFIPDRSGVIQIKVDYSPDTFGTLPHDCMITWPESSQINKYNYIDIGYGPRSNYAHYTQDLRPSLGIARAPISIYNELVVTEQQAISIANRIVSHIYSKAVSVKWVSDPSVDLYDVVGVYSAWTPEDETPDDYRPIKREIIFDGMLTEETTFVS